MDVTKSFSDFSVGDCAVFQQSFSADEFDGFAALSGDRNPLHHDAAHAATTRFEKPIVPLHMTMSPLSRIAGMIFPGEPSLYLGHEVRSILPVFYGETLTYSARITDLNPVMRIIGIRVLAIRGAEVVLDATMRVMAQEESWTVPEDAPDLRPSEGVALITGATGEIGTALAAGLARRGWGLLLQDRGPGPRREALAETLRPLLGPDQKIEHLAADLLSADAVGSLAETLAARGDVTAVFHTASPALTAPLSDLVAVNYAALQRISDAVLPGMLARQQGVVAAIGSVATERVIPGWHDYAAAKAMVGQYLTGFDKVHSEFGVRGLQVLSGLVATEYSASAQGASPSMLPEELAEAVLSAALDDQAGQAVLIEWNGRRDGRLGFHTAAASAQPQPTGQPTGQATAQPAAGDTAAPAAPGADVEAQVAGIIRRRFNLPAEASLAGAGVGVTPGWDSLRHIELVLDLESALGIRFRAGEVEKMLTYENLVSVVRERAAQSQAQS